MIVIGGCDRLAASALANQLTEWFDSRTVRICAPDAASIDGRPFLWPYWQEMPAKGRLTIVVGDWLTRTAVEVASHEISGDALRARLKSLRTFEELLAADGTSDQAQPKLERLMVLAEDITPAFIARHPNCKAYLEASLRIRGQWATLDPEAIERDYHDDEALPKEGTSPACYHMKDLIVHPATAAALLSAESPELAKCSTEAIVNAYDNTIAFTDQFLARVIDRLGAEDRLATSMLYVSDHGESLGENGLYLHAAPYFMAPDVQTQVPMVLWTSPSYRAAMGVDQACIKARAASLAGHVTHDAVFHTVLGLADVTTSLHNPELDLTTGCHG